MHVLGQTIKEIQERAIPLVQHVWLDAVFRHAEAKVGALHCKNVVLLYNFRCK